MQKRKQPSIAVPNLRIAQYCRLILVWRGLLARKIDIVIGVDFGSPLFVMNLPARGS
jgi:hypothetical protein